MSTCTLELRFAGVRLIEPQAVEKLAHSIERDGQIVPLIVVGVSPNSLDAKDVSGWCSSTAIAGWRLCAALAATEHSMSGGRVTWRKLLWVCWRAYKAGPLPRLKRHCCCVSSRKGLGSQQREAALRCGRDVSCVNRRLQLL